MSIFHNFLILTSEFPPGPGGIGQHAWCMASALVSQGNRVVVQTEGDYAGEAEVFAFDRKYQSDLLTIVRNSRKGYRSYLNRLRISHELLGNYQPDVIILSGRFSLWSGAWMKFRGFDLPVWAFVHGSEVGNALRWTTWLTLFALQRADRIIAVSDFTRSLLPNSLQGKCEVLPNGILSESMPIPETVESFPDWPGEPRLLTVGNVSPRKGQRRVIRALPALLRRYPQIHYHMVGLDWDRDTLEALAESLGVGGHITFHGKLAARHDLYRAYRSADLFIMLSENLPDGDVEGFGIAILEANHFGLPAIGARGCGIEDAIDHGQTGYLVDGNDNEEITRTVKEAYNNWQALGVRARQWAAAHDWNLLVHRLLRHEAR